MPARQRPLALHAALRLPVLFPPLAAHHVVAAVRPPSCPVDPCCGALLVPLLVGFPFAHHYLFLTLFLPGVVLLARSLPSPGLLSSSASPPSTSPLLTSSRSLALCLLLATFYSVSFVISSRLPRPSG
ncbi:hypothetical protein XA68_15981 [Ophiocordyceps unilateralis]|uniref:Uncharacterized protein n=1 Tax=Ophiocordyceps unilateralis TaxID=268505 RepID=A0A2A9P7H5_OPHUN|nr:hypothetical protein XA68_15981 [Ophiocordyceps unilateralis]